jgi:hypothetical protein
VGIGPIGKTAANVDVDGQEKEGGAVGMHVAQKSAAVDVPHDVLHQGKGVLRGGGIVEGEHDAGYKLNCQKHPRQKPPTSEIAKILRRWVVVYVTEKSDCDGSCRKSANYHGATDT